MTFHARSGFLGKLVVRFVLLSVLALLVAGCATPPPAEPPPRRDIYQKVTVSSYAGAASDPSKPAMTAVGTRYQSGAISSAAADWSRFPVGTIFRVLATGELFEVDDFTEDVVGRNFLLLYKPSSARVGESPEHQVTIEIVTWGSPKESASRLRELRSSTARKILEELVDRYPQVR